MVAPGLLVVGGGLRDRMADLELREASSAKNLIAVL